jgi:hypothetical protein
MKHEHNIHSRWWSNRFYASVGLRSPWACLICVLIINHIISLFDYFWVCYVDVQETDNHYFYFLVKFVVWTNPFSVLGYLFVILCTERKLLNEGFIKGAKIKWMSCESESLKKPNVPFTHFNFCKRNVLAMPDVNRDDRKFL